MKKLYKITSLAFTLDKYKNYILKTPGSPLDKSLLDGFFGCDFNSFLQVGSRALRMNSLNLLKVAL